MSKRLLEALERQGKRHLLAATLPTILCLFTPRVGAHTLEQRLGGYADNQGLTRQRIGYDLGWDGKTSGSLATLSAHSVAVTLLRDQYMKTEMIDDEYTRRFYGTGYRINQTASVSASQTWSRSTDTRQVLSYGSDGIVTSKTMGAGASQWVLHDTVRLGLDLSRTTVDQPEYRILDFDSQEVGAPPLVTSSGATLVVRHLASPTSIIDYTLQGLWADNRPPTTTWGVGLRQFVPPISGAVHLSAMRALNRGALSTATTYGEVDAWIFDGAYLQSLGRKTHGKVAYRYYREDETTRVYREALTIGTDRMQLALVHELPRGSIQNIDMPLSVEGAVSRYLTNTQLLARSFEVGVTGHF